MHNDQVDDLKQFIQTTVSQSEERVTGDLKQFVQTTVSQSEERVTGDLKQFVQTTVSQSEQRQLEDMKQFVDGRISQAESSLTNRIDQLEGTMNQGFGGVGDAIEQIHTDISGLDTRVTSLEDAAAA